MCVLASSPPPSASVATKTLSSLCFFIKLRTFLTAALRLGTSSLWPQIKSFLRRWTPRYGPPFAEPSLAWGDVFVYLFWTKMVCRKNLLKLPSLVLWMVPKQVMNINCSQFCSNFMADLLSCGSNPHCKQSCHLCLWSSGVLPWSRLLWAAGVWQRPCCGESASKPRFADVKRWDVEKNISEMLNQWHRLQQAMWLTFQ